MNQFQFKSNQRRACCTHASLPSHQLKTAFPRFYPPLPSSLRSSQGITTQTAARLWMEQDMNSSDLNAGATIVESPSMMECIDRMNYYEAHEQIANEEMTATRIPTTTQQARLWMQQDMNRDDLNAAADIIGPSSMTERDDRINFRTVFTAMMKNLINAEFLLAGIDLNRWGGENWTPQIERRKIFDRFSKGVPTRSTTRAKVYFAFLQHIHEKMNHCLDTLEAHCSDPYARLRMQQHQAVSSSDLNDVAVIKEPTNLMKALQNVKFYNDQIANEMERIKEFIDKKELTNLMEALQNVRFYGDMIANEMERIGIFFNVDVDAMHKEFLDKTRARDTAMLKRLGDAPLGVEFMATDYVAISSEECLRKT